MAQKREYRDIRLMAKRVNERMRQLEKMDIKSPAYRSLQATLEMLGKRGTDNYGRRFSEGKMYTYTEAMTLRSILTKALGKETLSIKGAKTYYDKVWQGALNNPNLKIKENGITREQWFDFWENMPTKEKDRTYGSEQNVKLLIEYTRQHGKLGVDNAMTAGEIAAEIQASTSLKDAYKKLGISVKGKKSRDLGAL